VEPFIRIENQDNRNHRYRLTKVLALDSYELIISQSSARLYYVAFLLRATPIRPNRPEPNNQTAAGTGTAGARAKLTLS